MPGGLNSCRHVSILHAIALGAVLRHFHLADLWRQPAAFARPGVVDLRFTPGSAFSYLPRVQIQVTPVAWIASRLAVMLGGGGVEVAERLQARNVRHGLTHVHIALQHVPLGMYVVGMAEKTAERGVVERLASVAMHEDQPVEHPAALDDPLQIAIKLDKRRLEGWFFLALSETHPTRLAIERAAAILHIALGTAGNQWMERRQQPGKKTDQAIHYRLAGIGAYDKRADKTPAPDDKEGKHDKGRGAPL